MAPENKDQEKDDPIAEVEYLKEQVQRTSDALFKMQVRLAEAINEISDLRKGQIEHEQDSMAFSAGTHSDGVWTADSSVHSSYSVSWL